MTLAVWDDEADSNRLEVVGIIGELVAIRAEMLNEVARAQARLAHVHPNFRPSAKNLLHYLVLRRRDLRPLQLQLAALGLSSLGRAESHVLATVDAVIEIGRRLTQAPLPATAPPNGVVEFTRGQQLLAEHTEALLGPAATGRDVRIMVTMPTEAANDYTLLHDLLDQGMDCMRINCAHDDASAWLRMIEHLRRAEQALGRSCRVVMDLAGPKLRTGPLQPGPAVVRARPSRDVYGRVTAPARVWLTNETSPQPPPSPADAVLPVAADWLAGLRPDDKVAFVDARNARRRLRVVDVSASGCWAELMKTAYLVSGIALRHGTRHGDHETVLGNLPARESALTLESGDLLIVTRDLQPGRPATRDSAGRLLSPATIGCTIPEVFSDARPGEAIWFDDGKIGGVIEQIESDQVMVRITQTRLGGAKLQADKGINLPESRLRLGALTPQDLEDLSFAAQHADVVELSFANSAADVELLQRHLSRQTAQPPAIVLKIETRRGFENLPEMLLAAMRSPSCGVMIARGDLAVECGFERMAEVQEEILWICEAAHVPVIWATQVLETLAKVGMPSRAEITDAAMGHRAECVMLNKGPHVVSAVRALDNIMRRMQAHQAKKCAMLRALRLARPLPDELNGSIANHGTKSQLARNEPT